MFKLFLGIIAFLMVGCTFNTETYKEDDDMTQTASGKTITKSATPTLHTQMNPDTVTGLQGGELEPGEYTLQFGLLPPAAVAGVEQTISAQAIINWKSDNQQQRRVISVIPGAAITGVCEGVDVSVQDLGQLFGPNTAGQPYKVPITLSKGSRANIQQPPMLVTQPAQTVANGAPVNFLVPRDSGVVAFQVLAAQSSPAPIAALDIIANQESNAFVMSSHYPLQNGGWIPLLSGVTLIEVVDVGANPALVQVVWGIEG